MPAPHEGLFQIGRACYKDRDLTIPEEAGWHPLARGLRRL
jgi:hypothetical protein